MVTYRGLGGFAETICQKAIELEQDRIQGDLMVEFYRTNKEHMEGVCFRAKEKPTCIRLGIATHDFYHNGLSTLFHELGHAQGMDHLHAVAYGHARLHELSGMKRMHNSQSVINKAVVERLVAQGIGNSASYSPRPVMVDLKRKGQRRVMELCGPYSHVLPYLDSRPDAMIFDSERRPLTERTIAGRYAALDGIMGAILIIPM